MLVYVVKRDGFDARAALRQNFDEARMFEPRQCGGNRKARYAHALAHGELVDHHSGFQHQCHDRFSQRQFHRVGQAASLAAFDLLQCDIRITGGIRYI